MKLLNVKYQEKSPIVLTFSFPFHGHLRPCPRDEFLPEADICSQEQAENNRHQRSNRLSDQSIGSTIVVQPREPIITKSYMRGISHLGMLPLSSKQQPQAVDVSRSSIQHTSYVVPRRGRMKTVAFVEGDESLQQPPESIIRLLKSFCHAKKTSAIPCTASYWAAPKSTKLTSSGRPAHFELLHRPGVPLLAARYKYGGKNGQPAQILVVAGSGLAEAVIINLVRLAHFQEHSKVVYAVWLGLAGWETTPSIARVETEHPQRPVHQFLSGHEEDLLDQVSQLANKRANSPDRTRRSLGECLS